MSFVGPRRPGRALALAAATCILSGCGHQVITAAGPTLPIDPINSCLNRAGFKVPPQSWGIDIAGTEFRFVVMAIEDTPGQTIVMPIEGTPGQTSLGTYLAVYSAPTSAQARRLALRLQGRAIGRLLIDRPANNPRGVEAVQACAGVIDVTG